MDIVNIHATCVMLARAGDPFSLYYKSVLLLGDSGSWKSDLALRLIDRSGLLVADDRTNLFVRDNKLMASAPPELAGLIEARGLGIMALSYEPEAEIALVVELVASDVVPRLPTPARYNPPAPLTLPESAQPPLVRLTAFDASAPAKIIWGIIAFQQALFRDERNPK